MLSQLRPAIVSVLVLAILTGFLFPGVVTALAQVAFGSQANGSLITQNGKVVGSRLIGQNFAKPIYFHSRPSSAGSSYDAGASSGSNLGPTSSKLINGIEDDSKTEADESFAGVKQLAAAYRKENGLAADAPLPADAVTRSASGLDPDISPKNALLQAARVAKARKLPVEKVRQLVVQNTQARQLGVLGEPRINVLELNMALDVAR